MSLLISCASFSTAPRIWACASATADFCLAVTSCACSAPRVHRSRLLPSHQLPSSSGPPSLLAARLHSRAPSTRTAFFLATSAEMARVRSTSVTSSSSTSSSSPAAPKPAQSAGVAAPWGAARGRARAAARSSARRRTCSVLAQVVEGVAQHQAARASCSSSPQAGKAAEQRVRELARGAPCRASSSRAFVRRRRCCCALVAARACWRRHVAGAKSWGALLGSGARLARMDRKPPNRGCSTSARTRRRHSSSRAPAASCPAASTACAHFLQEPVAQRAAHHDVERPSRTGERRGASLQAALGVRRRSGCPERRAPAPRGSSCEGACPSASRAAVKRSSPRTSCLALHARARRRDSASSGATRRSSRRPTSATPRCCWCELLWGWDRNTRAARRQVAKAWALLLRATPSQEAEAFAKHMESFRHIATRYERTLSGAPCVAST